MPRQIIKITPDEDFYVEWSSVVEAPIAWGPRDWMLDHLVNDYRRGTDRYEYERDQAEKRLVKADETGSSSPEPFGCTWADEGEIYQQQGVLPRANIGKLCGRLTTDPDADCRDLLRPFDA